MPKDPAERIASDDPDEQAYWDEFYDSDPDEAEVDAEEYFHDAMNKDD